MIDQIASGRCRKVEIDDPGTCLLCHTVDNAITQAGLDRGGYWRCQRCGQMWDAQRLAASQAYALSAVRQHRAAIG